MNTITEMLDLILKSAPILVAVMIYIVRLETKLSEICNDIKWIKKAVE